MATAYWLAFRSTWSGDSSQCWTWLSGWPITCSDLTTSPTRWSASIGCASLRESSSRLRIDIQSLRRTCAWVPRPFYTRRWPIQSTTLRSVGTNRLLVPISRLLVAELFRSPARRHGMTSRKTLHQQNRWPHFVVSLRHACSGSLFLTTCWTSTDCLRWT